MKSFNFLEKLNKKISSFCQINSLKQVDLLAGNPEETLLLTLKEKAPFSNVAILFTEKSVKKLLGTYQTLLKKEGYKIHNVVIKEKATYSTNDLIDGCVLPENVRVIVTFDYSLLTPLKYSSTINNVPAIFVNLENQTYNLLDVSDFIKNGEQVDVFNFDSEFTTIFNAELPQDANLNDLLIASTLNLDIIDYETAKIINGEKIDNIVSSLALKDTSSEKDNIFEQSVKYQVLNFLTLGELKGSSAFSLAVKASTLESGKLLTIKEQARIRKALFIIYNYGLTSSKDEILEITDYLGMLNKTCKRLKVDVFSKSEVFLKFLDDVLKNLDMLEKSIEKFSEILALDKFDFDEIFHLEENKPKKELKTCILDGIFINPYNMLGFLMTKGVLNKIL